MNRFRWFTHPRNSPEISPRNFTCVQLDAIGVGLGNAASQFLPVFLSRLNATTFEVGLLSSLPSITGLLLAIPLGRFLQQKINITRWYSLARLIVLSCYALTGLVGFVVPEAWLVKSVLLIWSLATFPQTLLAIVFTVLMNAIAGPQGRFELMTRRWSILGITTSTSVMIIGQILDRVVFPLNYQLMFIVLSLGGLISFYASSHIRVSETIPQVETQRRSLRVELAEMINLVFKRKSFVAFVVRRFVFTIGISLAAPIIPLYLVREVQASDGWIAAINTSQTATLVISYFFWTHLSRARGSRPILLWTTFGLVFYPLLMSFTHMPWLIALFAVMSGFFQAGLDLVFFDELMKTVPIEFSATFVSVAQSFQFLASIIAPLIATIVADTLGLAVGLIFSAAFRFLGFLLFLSRGKAKPVPAAACE